MHILSASLLFAGAATAATAPLVTFRSESFMALKSIVERQNICVPVPPPITCERSCGPGYVECIGPPNCYNPSLGQQCCSNGRYCPRGFRCTDAGCCPNDVPISQCGATITLSVIPPPQTDTPSSEPPSPSEDPTPSETPEPPSPSSDPPASSEEPSSTPEPPAPTVSDPPAASSLPAPNATSADPPHVTTAGANKATALGVVGLLGLGAVFMGL